MSAIPQFLQPYFRHMDETDLQQVIDAEEAAYTHPWTVGIFKDCLRVGYQCWVATDENNELLAYAIMSVAVGEAHLLNICVRPDVQGHGVGRQLLAFMLDQAREFGADTALLEVRPSNENALDLYSSHGFVEVGMRKAYYPSDSGREDALILAKYLT